MTDIGARERSSLLERHGRQFAAGASIYSDGDDAPVLFWLHEGRVRLTKRVRTAERNLAVVRPGDLFGEEALLPQGLRGATAVALTDVVAVALDRATVASLVAGKPELADWLIGELARRVREAEDQLENAMLRDQPSRVVNALLRLSQAMLPTGSEADEVRLAVSPLEISSRAGLDVDTVKRVVQQLRDGGYVHIVDETVQIPDPEGLRRLYTALGAKEEVRGAS